jgi:hypothetical protein
MGRCPNQSYFGSNFTLKKSEILVFKNRKIYRAKMEVLKTHQATSTDSIAPWDMHHRKKT